MKGTCVIIIVITLTAAGCCKGTKVTSVVDQASPAAVIDTTAPEVETVSPSADATDASVNTLARAVFNEGMDADSISSASFKVSVGESAIDGTVSYIAEERAAVFTPSAGLSAFKTYTVTISQYVADRSGNKLGADYSWRFTTAPVEEAVLPATPVPIESAPQISSSVPQPVWKWVEHNAGIEGVRIVGLAIDPKMSSTVYALVDNNGVYKSTDGGSHWVAKDNGLPKDKGVQWAHLHGDLLTMDPTNASVLYINIGGKPYKTADGGENWKEINNGIEVCAPYYQVAGIIVDRFNSSHLFAGHTAGGCGGGLFESVDGGGSWTQIAGWNVGSGLSNDSWPLVMDPSDSKKLYTGGYDSSLFAYSTNGGSAWTQKPTPNQLYGNFAVAVHPIETKKVFAGGENELFVCEFSQNEADEWQCPEWQSLVDQVSGQVLNIKFTSPNPSVGFVVGGKGVFKSTDGAGLKWSPLGHSDLFPRVVAVDPANPDIVYLGTLAMGIYKSTNGGTTFFAKNNGLPTTFDARRAIAGRSAYFVGVSGQGIFRSADSGESWWRVYPAKYLIAMAFAPSDPNVVYASVAGPNEIIRSADGGESWTTIMRDIYTNTLAVFPDDPDKLIGSKGNALYTTTDGGKTWTSKTPEAFKSLDYKYLMYLGVDPTDKERKRVYAFGLGGGNASPQGGAFRSVDGGETWEPCGDYKTEACGGCKPWAECLKELNVDKDALCIDCADCGWIDAGGISPYDGALYISTRSGRLFKSVDHGDSWRGIGPLPSNKETFSIIFDVVDPNTIYATDLKSPGPFKSTDGGSNWEAMPLVGLPEGGSLSNITHDPLNPARFMVIKWYQGIYIYETVE